jgi:hypothetical protein
LPDFESWEAEYLTVVQKRIDFVADRIELCSSADGVTPDPTKGLLAAALSRERDGWWSHLTLPTA